MKRNIIDDKPRDEWERIIRQWIHDEQGRYIITRAYLDGIPYERIAEELNVSRGTVFNKVKKFEAQLFKHCD